MTTESPKLVGNEAKIPQTSTSVYEARYNRRMASKFLDKPVENAAIERMLAAAVWAPNHRLNEPWRFFVLPKDSPLRAPLGDAVFEAKAILPAPTFSLTPTSLSTRPTAQDCETAGNHHPSLNARYWL